MRAKSVVRPLRPRTITLRPRMITLRPRPIFGLVRLAINPRVKNEIYFQCRYKSTHIFLKQVMASFNGNLLREIEKFDVFTIAGKFSRKSEKASIAFKSSEKAEADIVLEIDIRQNISKMILKSFKHLETLKSITLKSITVESIPLEQEENFCLHIMFYENKVDIALKGSNLCTYELELPYLRVKWISIDGDIAKISHVGQHKSFPPVQTDTKDVSFNADFPRRVIEGDKFLIELIASGDFSIFLGDEYITVSGTHDDVNQDIIKVKSLNEDEFQSIKWDKNDSIVIGFVFNSDSISVTYNGKVVAERIEINDRDLSNLRAKCNEDETLEVIRIQFLNL